MSKQSNEDEITDRAMGRVYDEMTAPLFNSDDLKWRGRPLEACTHEELLCCIFYLREKRNG